MTSWKRTGKVSAASSNSFRLQCTNVSSYKKIKDGIKERKDCEKNVGNWSSFLDFLMLILR